MAFTTREFAKYGFIRTPEKDFRDDGTSFRCWSYKGLEVSYAKWNDIYFISVHIPWEKYTFTVNDLLEQPWEKLRDEFNGCANPDLKKLTENIDIIEKGIEELEKKASDPNLRNTYINDLKKGFEDNKEESIEIMEEFRNIDWIHMDSYKRNSCVESYLTLESIINNAFTDKLESFSLKSLRNLWEDFSKRGYVDYRIQNCLKELKGVIKNYSL